MKGQWRMDDETEEDSGHDSHENSRDIQRMELLEGRFAAAEINRLITRQMRYRERVDTLDLPADLNRLRFARWLVEHGQLTEDLDEHEDVDEDVDSESGAFEGAPTDKAGHTPNANASLKYMPAPYWYAQPRLKCSPNCRSGGWRRSLSNVMAQLRLYRELARSSVSARISSSISKPGG